MSIESPLNLGLVASSTILVIDDEPLVRESIAIYLEDSGFNVVEAVDGQQGLEHFLEFSPDLVLCDLRMPRMDGITLLKKLMELSPQTPIIMVSGAGQINDVVEALRLGALDYIVKPVTDMAVLENAVVNGLHRKYLEKENQQFRQELVSANHELELHLDNLQQDQEAGRRAQLQLLPEPDSSIGNFRFRHYMVPSLNLSGDFIDYFQISERYLGFYIADVSGHGSAAAFVTMTLKSLVNQPLRAFRQGENETIIDPAALLKHLNSELLEANLGKHITLFFAVVDVQEDFLIYSVAGQYPAPVIQNGEQIKLLTDGGFPLGLFEWAHFNNTKMPLEDNFKLLMVSDGWLEKSQSDLAPLDESYLLGFAKQNFADIGSLMKPRDNMSQSLERDDITLFFVNKEIL